MLKDRNEYEAKAFSAKLKDKNFKKVFLYVVILIVLFISKRRKKEKLRTRY